jgi:tetratricopeptide (TPR) repeat protein
MANALADSGQWAESAQAFRSFLETQESPTTRLFIAILEQAAGNQKAYSEQCQEMFDRYAGNKNPDVRFLVATACIIGPNDTDSPDKVVALAQEVASLEKWHPGKRGFEGAALYRAGRVAEAVKVLEQVLPMYTFAKAAAKERLMEILISEQNTHFVMTRAYFDLGQRDKAAKSLEAVDRVHDQLRALSRSNATTSFGGSFGAWGAPCVIEIGNAQLTKVRQALADSSADANKPAN